MEERKTRGITQNIYLTDIFIFDDKKLFEVTGTSGNSYTVTICNHNSSSHAFDIKCTCPDFENRKRRCKHIYFILIRIMGVDKSDADVKIYSDNQLKNMYAKMEEVTNRLRYFKVIGNERKTVGFPSIGNETKNVDNCKDSKKDNKNFVERKSIDDICPICLDMLDLHGGLRGCASASELENDEELDWCRYGCGKSVHKNCFKMWERKRSSICVFCSRNWNK